MRSSCEARAGLAQEFCTAARLYAESVVALAISGMSEREYLRLRRLAKEAQSRTEAAWVAFEEHVEVHRCFDASCKIQSIASGQRSA
jgi:uncharacterized membrane protein YcjF (UPF0283 family)